jgi:hypothetical protein
MTALVATSPVLRYPPSSEALAKHVTTSPNVISVLEEEVSGTAERRFDCRIESGKIAVRVVYHPATKNRSLAEIARILSPLHIPFNPSLMPDRLRHRAA